VRVSPRRVDERFEVAVFDPPRRVLIDGEIGPFRAEIGYVLEQIAEGTRLTNGVELQPLSIISRVMVPLAASQIEFSVASNLDLLKRILEASRRSISPGVRTGSQVGGSACEQHHPRRHAVRGSTFVRPQPISGPVHSGCRGSEPTTLCMKVDPEAQWAELRAGAPIHTRLARLFGVHADERVSRDGANGERITGLWLGRLPEGWFVFHDVPVGARGADIDHVVIGPAGVFTINTMNLTGTIRVNRRSIVHNGSRTDFLPKANAEAHRAARLLSTAVGRPVGVRGLLAILADEWIVNRLPEDIYVGGPRSAKHWMLQQPPILRSSDVIVLAAAASKPKTWVETPALTLVPKVPTAPLDRRLKVRTPGL
jgi:hypothetical protein